MLNLNVRDQSIPSHLSRELNKITRAKTLDLLEIMTARRNSSRIPRSFVCECPKPSWNDESAYARTERRASSLIFYLGVLASAMLSENFSCREVIGIDCLLKMLRFIEFIFIERGRFFKKSVYLKLK